MLGIAGLLPGRIAQLAVQESSEVALRYVAGVGKKFEPWNKFWQELLEALPPCAEPLPDVLPHPTRFVSMTGFTRKGPGLVAGWHRPGRRTLVTG